MTNKYRYFLESDFVGVNGLFVLIYSNTDGKSKSYKSQRFYLPKGIIRHCNVIIDEKNTLISPLIVI